MRTRKPHQHEQDGQRFACSDPNCRMPFRAEGPALMQPVPTKRTRRTASASREEQHQRYLDCGPAAWDDRGQS